MAKVREVLGIIRKLSMFCDFLNAEGVERYAARIYAENAELRSFTLEIKFDYVLGGRMSSSSRIVCRQKV